MKTVIYYTLYINQPNLGLETKGTYELPLTSQKIRQIADAISRALEEDDMTTFHNALCVGTMFED